MNPDGHEGPLAEFVALRQELELRTNYHNQLHTLQLTFTGALFGFAISRNNLILLLLVVPIISYLICARYTDQRLRNRGIARYIRDYLSDRVPGGLNWEQWNSRRSRPNLVIGWTIPSFATYVGPPILALAWTAGTVFVGTGRSAAPYLGLLVIWFVGTAVTALTGYLIIRDSIPVAVAAVSAPPAAGKLSTFRVSIQKLLRRSAQPPREPS
jgi:hypothetical protein